MFQIISNYNCKKSNDRNFHINIYDGTRNFLICQTNIILFKMQQIDRYNIIYIIFYI